MTRRQFIRCVPAVLLCLLIPCELLGRPQTANQSAASDPQAITLAAKALLALTGGNPVSDVILTGTAMRTAGSDVESGTIILKALGTTNSRMEFDGSSGTYSETRTDATGVPQGSWISLDGATHAMAGHNCLTDAVWFFPALTVISRVDSFGVIVTYLGQETRSGASVQHIRFTRLSSAADPTGILASLAAEDVYLDATTFLPMAVLFNTHPNDNAARNIAVEIDFSEYGPSAGAQTPQRIKELLNNSVFLDITVQSVTLNSGLAISQFAL